MIAIIFGNLPRANLVYFSEDRVLDDHEVNWSTSLGSQLPLPHPSNISLETAILITVLESNFVSVSTSISVQLGFHRLQNIAATGCMPRSSWSCFRLDNQVTMLQRCCSGLERHTYDLCCTSALRWADMHGYSQILWSSASQLDGRTCMPRLLWRLRR